jgi:hypothetical protein
MKFDLEASRVLEIRFTRNYPLLAMACARSVFFMIDSDGFLLDTNFFESFIRPSPLEDELGYYPIL